MTLIPPLPVAKNEFPLWSYLNQPLFKESTVLNPFQFWHREKIQFLEHCWEQNSVLFLERCWKQNYESNLENQSTDSH